MLNTLNRVKDTTTTPPGVGNVTVSNAAITSYVPLSNFTAGTSNVPLLTIDITGARWELALCTVLTATTYSRDTILSNSNGDTNPVNFNTGTQFVTCDLPASVINAMMTAAAIPFTTAIPLNNPGDRFMPVQIAASVFAFTLAAGTALVGSQIYAQIIADGTHAPTFAAPFIEHGNTAGYTNTNGVTNILLAWFDGNNYFYSWSSALTPVIQATGLTLVGPSSGVNGVASTNFTVTIDPVGANVTGTVVATVTDSVGGDTKTPLTLNLLNGTLSGTFTITPSSLGNRTIGITNNGGLINPPSLTYNSTASPTVPAAPTMLTAVQTGSTTADVPFTVGSDGGSTITSTIAEAYISGVATGITGTFSGAGSGTIHMTGLTASTTYTFKANSVNSVGSGALSTASNSITTSSGGLLVDQLTSATPIGAYSFSRKIVSAYAGPCIKVRNGATLTDIGFSGNDIDLTALAAAAAGGNLNLVTIYDQYPTANHLTQATNGNQWTIVNSGVNVTSNGKLAWNPVNFAAGDLVSGTITAAVASCAAVASGNVQASGAAIVGTGGGNTTDPIYAPSATGGALAARYNNVAATTLKVNGASASSMPTSGANTIYSDAAARAITSIIMGTDSSISHGWSGFINEVILWSGALSSGDQTTLQANQKAYFGTP